jgi:hypothetical protein
MKFQVLQEEVCFNIKNSQKYTEKQNNVKF